MIKKTKYILTCWNKDITQEQFYNEIVQLPIERLVIGALEKTQENIEHYHVYVKTEKGIDFERIKKICNTIHLEQVYSTETACYNYCTKEGTYYTNFTPKRDAETIEYDLINDIYSGMSKKDIILKYPKYAIYHYDNISKIIDYMKGQKNNVSNTNNNNSNNSN